VVIFNYPQIEGNPYGTIRDEHFELGKFERRNEKAPSERLPILASQPH
jgi:hypothetical protein